ncbi:MAG TPA: hypothetical protein VLE27_12420 [Thermoanaerobaculia bacterium]|nr:hypothetical protein [Thermoanaerobaculia bacterium]
MTDLSENAPQRATEATPPEGGVRKLYVQPVLIVYGSLRSLTGQKGNGVFDGVFGSGEDS